MIRDHRVVPATAENKKNKGRSNFPAHACIDVKFFSSSIIGHLRAFRTISFQERTQVSRVAYCSIPQPGYHASSFELKKYLFDLPGFPCNASYTILANRRKSCRRVAWAAEKYACLDGAYLRFTRFLRTRRYPYNNE